MFLKRIEISGFKSFADRTELEFVPGITAVVGPNGSGKSNISDAIRWVLGEQSAKSLRGGKMEDIIFAGSVTRKPVNYGEVSITLDNQDERLPIDYSEVTVTRRLHRSGESEYFINKQACRLRDITELFMDTGIGKEAYSIIGQGKIEEILSSKSEDRRGIFEEASGIVKYKTRKREAQKKLEATEQNMLRVHDLLSELEGQLEPLREQAEKAARYKDLRERLKSLEISLYVHQIGRLHGDWREAGETLQSLKLRETELSALISAHDAELERHRLDIRRLEDEIEALQAQLLAISEDLEKCEGQGEVLKERKRNLIQNREQLERQLGTLEERRAALAGEEEDIRGKLRSARDDFEALLETISAEEARLMEVAGGLGGEAEERLKGELLETLNRMAQHRNELRYVEQQEESGDKRLDRLSGEIARLTREWEKAGESIRQLEQERQDVLEAIGQAKDRYARLSEELKQENLMLAEAHEVGRKWQQKIDSLASRRSTLLELKAGFDGFMQGVREVLKARDRNSGGPRLRGIRGAVAELVKVPAQYEPAIETALGGALQHIVVDDEASAREAIAYLKQRNLGRATFLPLDVIRGRSIASSELRQMEQAEGYVGIAADLIAFEDRYAEIMRSLLGNVIVADTLEHANRIAARGQYRYRVVTLEGDVVHPGGSMTGGSLSRRQASILGRQREIEELGRELDEARSSFREVQQKTEAFRASIERKAQELDQLRAQGEDLRLREQQIAARIEAARAEQANLAQQKEIAEQERIILDQDKTSLVDRKKELEQSLKVLQEEEAVLQQAIRDAEESRKAHEQEKEELQHRLTALKVQAAAAEKQKESLEEQLKRVRGDMAALEGDIARQHELLQANEREMARTERDQVEQQEKGNDLKIRRAHISGKLEETRAERAEKLRFLEEEESKTRDERLQLRQLEEQLRETEVRVNRLDVELEGLLRKLAEEYELSFELAASRYPAPEDVAGTQQAARELKRDIAALGEVNLGAIEEHERVSERYSFLNRQMEDLVEAKQTLYKVIREMDEEMSRRFHSTFADIREWFRKVFVRLFGGGQADLVLTEPDNPLETGIEIVAQPPGKKLQNLQLLSGGEKALTAIALLFAILHVKPVPFCVLDEVEAALDEANVARFAEYLREFSAQTQFIVVTHRKGTMEEADVLYGVTMEDDGVSRLVSVRLEDGEPVSA